MILTQTVVARVDALFDFWIVPQNRATELEKETIHFIRPLLSAGISE